jgi:hypothetical protein
VGLASSAQFAAASSAYVAAAKSDIIHGLIYRVKGILGQIV